MEVAGASVKGAGYSLIAVPATLSNKDTPFTPPTVKTAEDEPKPISDKPVPPFMIEYLNESGIVTLATI